MLRPSGRSYRDLTHRRDAAARDGRRDDDGLDDDGLEDEAEDGSDGVSDDVADDSEPEIRADRPRSEPRKYSRTVNEVTRNIERQANEMLRGLPVHDRFDKFLHVLIASFACSLAGVAHTGQRVTFREGYTEAEFSNCVIAAVAKNIRERALEVAGQRPDLYINLKVAAALEGKDSNDDKNLGLDKLDVDLLRRLAISAFKLSRPREEIAFREAMLARDLTVKDRALTLTHLATAYGMAGNEQKALEIREQLLAYLRSGIETEYAACDMEFSLPVAVYRVRLSIARFREKPGGTTAEVLAAMDDERIAACHEVLEHAELEEEVRQDALKTLILIHENREQYRDALIYALKILEELKRKRLHGPMRMEVVERIRTLVDKREPIATLDEAIRLSPTLDVGEFLNWISEAESKGDTKAQIALREAFVTYSENLAPETRIKTLTRLSYNYEEVGDYEKALLCLERIIEIKRETGEMSRRELGLLQDRGRTLMAAIPPDPAEVLAETLRNPMVRRLFSFLAAFQDKSRAWVNGDSSNISIPIAERPALIAAWAAILRDEEQIIAVVGVRRLRGLMRKFRDSLSGGSVKSGHVRQMLAILQPPAQPAQPAQLAARSATSGPAA